MTQKQTLDLVLRKVSRSFYLTMRILPPPLKKPIGIAYLLARTADTISDTPVIVPSKRMRYLLALRAQVNQDNSPCPIEEIVRALSHTQDNPSEQSLIKSLPDVLHAFMALPVNDRSRVQNVVNTLIQGMEIDLHYFPNENESRVRAFQNQQQLDDYIYKVAGCVGKFWTELAIAHLPALAHWDREYYQQQGIQFGKALQLTNILRDVASDLRIGRCYLPLSELKTKGLSIASLQDQNKTAAVHDLLIHWIHITINYYQSAERYTLAIPRRCLRLRLAVIWPIVIGYGTLALLINDPSWPSEKSKNKVSRRWIYRMMLSSLMMVASNTLLKLWFKRWRQVIEEKVKH